MSCPRGQDIETHYSAPAHSQFWPKELREVPLLSSPERFWNCKLKSTQGQFQVPCLLRHWKIPGVPPGMLLPFHSSGWDSERNSLLSQLGTAFSATLGVFCRLFGGEKLHSPAPVWGLHKASRACALCWVCCQLRQGFPGDARGKEIACQCWRRKRYGFDPWAGKISWRRKCRPTPVFLPGKSHRERSLAGYSPKGRKELDTTEAI